MQDANFEDLLLKDNSWNVHENNIHTLLIEIYKLMNNLSPQIMKDSLDLKNSLYDLRSKQLLKLPENSTSRYSTQALCFKGSLIWNTIRNKINSFLHNTRSQYTSITRKAYGKPCFHQLALLELLLMHKLFILMVEFI